MSISFGVGALLGTEECAAFGIIDDNITEPTESFTITASGGEFLNGQDLAQVAIGGNDGESNVTCSS